MSSDNGKCCQGISIYCINMTVVQFMEVDLACVRDEEGIARVLRDVLLSEIISVEAVEELAKWLIVGWSMSNELAQANPPKHVTATLFSLHVCTLLQKKTSSCYIYFI